ncbi:MAG: hypothetical protein AAFV28_10805 [Cyanobacteria bacterium J06635_13]
MKYRVFFNTLIPFVIVVNLFQTRQSQAEPSPIFEPIIENIKTRLPSGLKMRLPASVLSTQDSILYSFLPNDDRMLAVDLEDIEVEFFTVLIADCSEQKNLEDCLVAAVGVSEDPIKSQAELDKLLANHEGNFSTIEFGKEISGFYFEQPQLQAIVWRQKQMAHLLVSRRCPSDRNCISKQQLIKMAKSAAEEPAITSRIYNFDTSRLN